METPNVVHPKPVKIKGFTFQIISYSSLTDEQALKAAIYYYQTHKLKKSDQKKLLKVITTFDQDSVGLL